jgi:hypothetical protein
LVFEIGNIMSKTESVIVSFVLLIVCPLAAAPVAVVVGFELNQYAVISEKAYISGVLTVLAGVIFITTIELRHWAARFYYLRAYVTLPVFLLLSVLALSVCMGTLVGNLVLGALAGLYLGRRGVNTHMPVDLVERSVRRGSLFTAVLMGLMASAMGVLAVGEQHTLKQILSLVRLGRLAENPTGRWGIVSVAVPVLIALQYSLTRLMARWGYGAGLKEG